MLEVILRTKKKIPPPSPPPLVPTPPPINGSCLEYSETKRNMIFVFVHCRGKNNPLGTDQIFPSSSVKVVKLDQMLHSRLSSFGSWKRSTRREGKRELGIPAQCFQTHRGRKSQRQGYKEERPEPVPYNCVLSFLTVTNHKTTTFEAISIFSPGGHLHNLPVTEGLPGAWSISVKIFEACGIVIKWVHCI